MLSEQVGLNHISLFLLTKHHHVSNYKCDIIIDSVLAFKQRNKLGRFADVASVSSAGSAGLDEEASREEANKIHVGDRCQVDVSGGGYFKRGVVRFVGKCA
jgi:hypothetical protein